MQIAIQNIYYLLCYAWDHLAEEKVIEVETIDPTSLVDLFARVLINGTHHLLKRGFDRGYISQHEWTGRLRGRMCIQEVVSRNARVTGRLPCDFDELSYDVLHNRILKTTMRRLIRTQGLTAEHVKDLTQLCRWFSEIRDIELNGRLFRQVQLHRNNQFYDFLLKVCELIYRNLLISEETGSSKFMNFVQDQQQMAMLFEKFVRNFYQIERKHHGFQVGGENIEWRWISGNLASQRLLPKMRTDISLTSATRKIIIDCKFTPEATQHHYSAETLRSAHLYQISAYMNNLTGNGADTCEMMLLYPTVDASLSADYTHGGHRICIRTINLNQPCKGIHRDLLALIA